MNHAVHLSTVTELAVALLVLLGAGIALLGSFGLIRLKTFYERVHAPALVATLGTGFIVLASIVLYSALEGRPVLHAMLIGIFIAFTTPAAFMILARAAVHREESARHR